MATKPGKGGCSMVGVRKFYDMRAVVKEIDATQ